MEEYSLISPKKLIIFGASNSGKSTFTEFFSKKKGKDGEIDKGNKSKSTDNGNTKIINIA
jgi:adenylate kinase family enzyme